MSWFRFQKNCHKDRGLKIYCAQSIFIIWIIVLEIFNSYAEGTIRHYCLRKSCPQLLCQILHLIDILTVFVSPVSECSALVFDLTKHLETFTPSLYFKTQQEMRQTFLWYEHFVHLSFLPHFFPPSLLFSLPSVFPLR